MLDALKEARGLQSVKTALLKLDLRKLVAPSTCILWDAELKARKPSAPPMVRLAHVSTRIITMTAAIAALKAIGVEETSFIQIRLLIDRASTVTPLKRDPQTARLPRTAIPTVAQSIVPTATAQEHDAAPGRPTVAANEVNPRSCQSARVPYFANTAAAISNQAR